MTIAFGVAKSDCSEVALQATNIIGMGKVLLLVMEMLEVLAFFGSPQR